MLKRFTILGWSILLLLSACAPAPVSAPTSVPATATVLPAATEQAFQFITIAAPSLTDNLVGEPTERKIAVYLPPAYAVPDRRFPTVYYLPGYGDSTLLGFNLPAAMDALIASGQVGDMIVVVADGVSKLGGSFYVNSPVTGNWEDFIAQDVVGYVDSHYRTLAQAESRGIAGHSMGGFGALSLAMHRPDVFGAVYSLSPGLFDENGLAESQMFGSDSLIGSFVQYEKELTGLPLDEAQERMLFSPQEFALSYGYAFAPNADRQPPYYDYPFQEVDGQLIRDDTVWQKWEAGFGGIASQIPQYKDNWLKLKGIVVDYGDRDEYAWIPKGCAYLGEQFAAAGIPAKVEAYSGTHQSALGERIGNFMFPFFSAILAMK